MASNPIQRRARQSFLIGFLLALIIMAIVVVLLFVKINKLNAQVEAERVKTITVYTALATIKSGEKITPDMLVATKLRSEMPMDNYVTSSYFDEVDEEGNSVEYISKIEIAAGSLLTAEMVYDSKVELAKDERIIEYNMISLPSQLQNHDYIDIRLSFPNGETYIVLSKKYVEQTTSASIWIRMSEVDIFTLNSAMIDAYQVQGARLYAVKYIEPGLQEPALETYAANNEVMTAMSMDTNILQEARDELNLRWTTSMEGASETNYTMQRSKIETYKSTLDDAARAAAVATANNAEDNAIKSARDSYVAALEGSGLVGIDMDY